MRLIDAADRADHAEAQLLGRPGAQVAAVSRRSEGFFIVHVESGKPDDYPLVNGQPIGPQARLLEDNDVIQLAGVKMGFFVT